MKLKFFAPATLGFSLALAIAPSLVSAMPAEPQIEVAQTPTQLTEANIQAVVDQLQAARTSEDIETSLGLLAPFAVTEVKVQTGSGSTTVITRLEGIDAHRQMLEESFGQIQSRETLENYVTINLISDSFGTAEIYQIENLEDQEGQSFIAASQTVLRLGRVDGQVLITSATVDGWISVRPAQK